MKAISKRGAAIGFGIVSSLMIQNAAATTLLQDDFESYSPGSNLVGQNG